MDNERSSVITISGKSYEMTLTTRATKEISKRYGGLENLGEKLLKSEHFEEAISEIVWLITLLCNQSILIHNYQNSDKKELLTEDEVEIMTTPSDLTEYRTAIMNAMYKGTKREVESEDIQSKNK